jgi:hypothetical protein
MWKHGRRTKLPTPSMSAPVKPFPLWRWRTGSEAGVRRTSCRLLHRASPLPSTGKSRFGTAATIPGAAWCRSLGTRDRYFICCCALACRSTRTWPPCCAPRLSRASRSFRSRCLHHPISHRYSPRCGRDHAALARSRATLMIVLQVAGSHRRRDYCRGGIRIRSVSCSLVSGVAVNFRLTASGMIRSRPVISSGETDDLGKKPSRMRSAFASVMPANSA